MATPVQIEANRRNAQKSTGPKSAEGKARSRLNGTTHGFRSEVVAIPPEDQAGFAASLAGFLEDWKPRTDDRRQLVERAATAAWQARRCVQIETARLTERVNAAFAEWDAREAAEAATLFDRLATEPNPTLTTLEQSRPGVDRLIAAWSSLRAAATEPNGWNSPDDHHRRFLNLFGHLPTEPNEEARALGDVSWRLILTNRPDLAALDRAKPFDARFAAQVRAHLVQAADSKLAILQDLRTSLPDDPNPRNRFADLSAFALHPGDEALRRHEARFDREFRACLALLRKPTKADAPSEPNLAATGETPTEANPATRADAPSEPNETPRDRECPPRSIVPPTEPSPARGGGLDSYSLPTCE
jgi:hypothetical protein